MTKAEQKLQVAKDNREEIVTMIKSILIDEKSGLDLKGAMEAFLSATTKDCSDAFMVMCNGYQKVRQVASKTSKLSNYQKQVNYFGAEKVTQFQNNL